jgi:toxin CptA
MKSAPAIAFDYRPSRSVGLAIGGMTVLSLLAISHSGISMRWGWILAVAALSTGLHALYRHFHPGMVRIARTGAGWMLVDRRGLEYPVDLIRHIRRGLLLVLHFRHESGHRRSFVLMPDNVDADLRRRLLLALATEPKPDAVGAGPA